MARRTPDNPLLPRAAVLEMYRTMLLVRELGQSVFRSRHRRGFKPGLEACWVAPLAAMGLRETDWISVPPSLGAAVDVAAGVALRKVARGDEWLHRLRDADGAGLGRIYFAVGAASRTLTQPSVDRERPLHVIFLEQQDLTGSEWDQLFATVAELELSVALICPPASRARTNAPALADAAQRHSIPSFRVDAADALALYRVSAETAIRLRANGGPVVIEPVVLGSKADPAHLLRQQILSRGLASEPALARDEARVLDQVRPSS